ncbi:E3 ubiquitin-protein ligase UBR7 [Blastomyces parvus]|uniref:E3 ubiquitin-protein ligase UBR7 n=1 Tax=Blastomyces parvus TaxID=2060905 RepID=A0A2B7WZ91_9EURO|nr:E3 ubiquitin-protein ligase UBR7 [Blastomyces parvus]
MDAPGSQPATNATAPQMEESKKQRRDSLVSNDSQTASDFIDSQLRLEADAREALPYANPNEPYNAAGVCYSCSISCHGEHTLIELFSKRNFVCDCGTTRFPSTSPCCLRLSSTGTKGVHSEKPAPGNKYNGNFRNIFCGCEESYDPHQEKGTMFQCLGLGTVENGGCGEDWYHPECLLGLPRNWAESVKKEPQAATDDKEPQQQQEQQQQQQHNGNGEIAAPATADEEAEEEPPLPPGFPDEDDFETFICYKCVDANPWLKRYAGTPGFLPAVYRKVASVENSSNGNTTAETTKESHEDTSSTISKKREREDNSDDEPNTKRHKEETSITSTSDPEVKATEPPKHKHESLPANAPTGTFSLFLKEDFRDHLCHCPSCFPNLVPHPQLREEEETYEPPLSEAGDDANGNGSNHTGSLLDRGEAALSNIDRVRAIEGVMVYNHLKDKVKAFLKPFAESGQAVGAEDIKAYFEKLRGDDQAINEAGGAASSSRSPKDGNGENGDGSNRKEQSGELINHTFDIGGKF